MSDQEIPHSRCGNASCPSHETIELSGTIRLTHERAGDSAVYPDDDLQAALVEDKWKFAHKDGRPIKAGLPSALLALL